MPAPGGPPHVWLLRVSTHRSALPGSLALLDTEERGRHAAFLRDADRDSYAAAHIGLRRLLGGYLGLEPDRVPFLRETCPTCGGPHGRPAAGVAGAPHFSLSHSGDLVLFAFAGTPVGADVEKAPSAQFADDVAGSLHPVERTELAALAGEAERTAAFVRCWTRKEAYLKGTGEGLSGNPARDYVGCGPDPAPLPGWQLADCPVDPGYGAAVAVATG